MAFCDRFNLLANLKDKWIWWCFFCQTWRLEQHSCSLHQQSLNEAARDFLAMSLWDFHIKIDQNLLDIEPRIKSIHFQFLCLHLYFAGTIGRRRSIIERCWWHCSLCLIPWSSYVHKFHYGSSEWFWAYRVLLLRFLFPQVAIPSSLILLWL